MRNNLSAILIIACPLYLIALGLFSKTPSEAATADGSNERIRVGYVDIGAIMSRTDFVLKIRESIQTELRERVERRDALREEYAALQREIAAQKTVLSDTALDAKVRQGIGLKAQIDELQYGIDKFVQDTEESNIAPAHDHIVDAIHLIARERGFDMVIRRENLVYGAPEVDLSAAVIEYLNLTTPLPPQTASPTPTPGS